MIDNIKITVAEDDIIDTYDDIAYPFFSDILDMNYDECLVTDETMLSDFSSCGLPVELSEDINTLPRLYEKWRDYIIEKINNHYNINIDSTHIYLIHLFKQIKQTQKLH